MKDPEETIERVFDALRSAEPPEGMEHRVLRAAQRHGRDATHAAPRLRWPVWLMLSSAWRFGALCGGAAIAGLLALVLTLALPRRGVPPANAGIPQVSHTQSAQKTVVAREAEAEPSRQTAEASAHTRTGYRGRKLVSVGPPDDMHLASFPAPPLPLTAQEKLLLRIARRGRTEEYALLNPEIRAQQEAETQIAFLEFFEPPFPPKAPPPEGPEKKSQGATEAVPLSR